jgi:hypothetical protein
MMCIRRSFTVSASLGLALVLVLGTALLAQNEGQPGQGRGQGRRGQGGFGQGGFGQGGFGQGGGAGGFQGGRLGTLMRPDVRRELELMEDQQEKIRQISEEMRDRMRDAFGNLRDLDPEERREAFAGIQERIQEIQGELDKRVDEVLLPIQRDQLDRIIVRQQLRFGGGVGGGLNNDAVARALKLSEEQRRQLAERAREAEAELREQTTKLRDEAREKVLSVLTPEQRATYRELAGEDDRP